jgi:hypothetical protein
LGGNNWIRLDLLVFELREVGENEICHSDDSNDAYESSNLVGVVGKKESKFGHRGFVGLNGILVIAGFSFDYKYARSFP